MTNEEIVLNLIEKGIINEKDKDSALFTIELVQTKSSHDAYVQVAISQGGKTNIDINTIDDVVSTGVIESSNRLNDLIKSDRNIFRKK